VLVGVLYLITLTLSMMLIDKGIYQQTKQSLIFEKWSEMLNINTDRLNRVIGQYLITPDGPTRDRHLQAIQTAIDEEFTRSNGVWRIRFVGEGGAVLAEREDSARRHATNTWRNSLFFRDFSRELQSNKGPQGEQLLVQYSSPQDVPIIETLTGNFRMIAFAVWVSITLAFALAIKLVILPIRRVMGQVQERGADLLRRPSSALERGYNSVATEALAARLSQRITDLVQTPSLWTAAEFDPPMIQGVREIFGFRAAALVAVEPTTQEIQIRALDVASDAVAESEKIEPELRRTPVEWEWLAASEEPRLLRRTGELLGGPTAIAPVLETASSRLGLVVVDEGDWSVLMRWQSQMIQAVAAEVRRGLVQMPVFRDYLFRQKSQANISLARSLGHDLTNVIATSKFDILAIQTWLAKRQKRIEESNQPPDKHEGVLADSVKGLLNTTKFMQEIVNIYRAFSYMDEPRWEQVDFNDLVAHLCDLFRLTLSRRIEVVDELDPAVPPVMCEPRLVQLALFNMLTNANQAIKRRGEQVAGTITVSTSMNGTDDQVEIRVRDSGPGFLGPDGKPLEGEAIYQIFFLGITTRREGEDRGEGLGLNWVWTIFKDFHGGEIEPLNHREGGAEFRVRLPVAGKPGAGEKSSSPPAQDANDQFSASSNASPKENS
jgi:signal transduction histidine kinase